MWQTIFGVAGGLAIFLYGMQLSGEGLQKAAGGTLRTILHKLTNNRLSAVLVGAVVTLLLQSSSATTVILVGLVRASLMSLEQTIGVILGADIGTTLTVQLIAFKITNYALLLIAIGFLIMFLSKRQKHKFIGQVFLGFGFIFFGMYIMSSTMEPLKTNPTVADFLLRMSESPFLAVLVATALTAVIQSSAATIGLALSLSMQGLMGLEAAIPVIFGANIGTCATALLASIGASREAKQVAIVHVLFKILGVLIFFPFLEPFSDLVRMTSASVPRQIANAHTIFNLGITLIFLPFTSYMAKLVKVILPVREEERELVGPVYLDRHALATPVLALDQAFSEVMRVARLVQDMVHNITDILVENNETVLQETIRKEEAVDRIFKETTTYLADISEQSLSDQDSQRNMSLLYVINDLEHIGDIMANIAHFGQKKIGGRLTFSKQGDSEIAEMQRLVESVLDKAIDAFAEDDKEKAREVILDLPRIIHMERRLRHSHITRLQAGLGYSRATSSIHLDVINSLERIADHAGNIAQVVLGRMTIAAHKEMSWNDLDVYKNGHSPVEASRTESRGFDSISV